MEERKSWQVKDEAVLEDLVVLMGLTDDEKAVLATLNDAAEAAVDTMLGDFYARLTAHAPTAEYFAEQMAHDHAKKSLRAWFVDLFSGNYGSEYVQGRLQIGRTHVRIGLPVRYPLAMMDVIMNHAHRITANAADTALATTAFNKLLALDIAVFNQAYEDTQLQHLAEMVGNERLARRLLTQDT